MALKRQLDPTISSDHNCGGGLLLPQVIHIKCGARDRGKGAGLCWVARLMSYFLRPGCMACPFHPHQVWPRTGRPISRRLSLGPERHRGKYRSRLPASRSLAWPGPGFPVSPSKGNNDLTPLVFARGQHQVHHPCGTTPEPMCRQSRGSSGSGRVTSWTGKRRSLRLRCPRLHGFQNSHQASAR